MVSIPATAIESREEAPTAIKQLVGPFFLGIIINYFLWGIQVTQSYHYYKTYRKTDRLWMKAAVLMIFIIDGLQSICTSHASWTFMVDGWGDSNLVNEVLGWGVYLVSFTDTFTTSIVHLFYAQMIWHLFNPPYNYVWTGIILALSATQLSAGTGQTALMANIHISLAQFDRIRTWVFVWLIPASLCDMIITALMTVKLSKSRTGFKRTDDIITKLIRMTVETGLATAVVQIGDLIVYLIWPVTPYHAVLTFMAPKVYSNSMLALLNSRQPPSQQNAAANSHSSQWDSRPDKPISSNIQVHTAHTISRSTDFELDTRKAVTASRGGGDRVIDVKSSSPFARDF